MEMKQLKKMLAGMSIASLIAGSSLLAAGCATNGQSAWGGDKSSTGSTQTEKKPGSSWSGTKPAAGSTDQKPAGQSSWGGKK